MGRAHPVAALVEDAAGQEGGRAAQPTPPLHRLRRKSPLHGLEQLAIEDGRVVAPIHLAAVDDIADIEAVPKQIGERPHAEPASTNAAAICELAGLAADAPAAQIVG